MGHLSCLRVLAIWVMVVATASSYFAVESFRSIGGAVNRQQKAHILVTKPSTVESVARVGPLLKAQGGGGAGGSTILSTSNDGDASSTTSSEESTSSSSSSSSSKSLIVALDDFGQSFQSRAEKSTAKAYQTDSNGKKIQYTIQTCVYYMLFMMYRAVRGAIVILPAVFRNVYKRFETTLDIFDSILRVQDNATTSATTITTDNDDNKEAVSKKKTKVWTTKLTSGILAGFLTLSYVGGGAVRVGRKFFGKLSKTSSFPQSFEIASNQMIQNEKRLERLIDSIKEELPTGAKSNESGTVVNGDDDDDQPDNAPTDDSSSTTGF